MSFKICNDHGRVMPCKECEENDRMDRMAEELLPDWAKGLCHGRYMIGTQLPTKDGRRIGNAHIIEMSMSNWEPKTMVYTILTDAGSRCHMTASELAGAFHPPKYYSELKEILRKFEPRQLQYVGYRCWFFKEPDKIMHTWGEELREDLNPNAFYERLYIDQLEAEKVNVVC